MLSSPSFGRWCTQIDDVGPPNHCVVSCFIAWMRSSFLLRWRFCCWFGLSPHYSLHSKRAVCVFKVQVRRLELPGSLLVFPVMFMSFIGLFCGVPPVKRWVYFYSLITAVKVHNNYNFEKIVYLPLKQNSPSHIM